MSAAWVGPAPDTTFMAVDADPAVAPVSVAGFSVFGLGVDGLVLHECVLGESGWRVSDAVTGCALTRRVEDNKQAALDAAVGMVEMLRAEIEGRRKAVLEARSSVSFNADVRGCPPHETNQE